MAPYHRVCFCVEQRDFSSPVAGRTYFQTLISNVFVSVCLLLLKQLEVVWHVEHPE